MDTDEKRFYREQWALLRFAVVGPMIAAPPAVGELRSRLVALSERVWRHPVTGLDVRFGASSIERWYYNARSTGDPIAILRNRTRCLGRFPSLSPRAVEVLATQYREHPGWTAQLHFDNLRVALTGSDSLLPSYPTIRRYLKARGMFRMPQEKDTKSSGPRDRWHKWVDSLMRDIVPDVPSSTLTGRALLIENLLGKHFQRQKSLVVLANEQGFTNNQITKFLGVSSSSVYRYLKTFHAGGEESLFQRKLRVHKGNDETLKKAVFSLLHEPPSLYGLNRTTWKKVDIKKVLELKGFPVCLSVIRTIIRLYVVSCGTGDGFRVLRER